MSTITDEQVAQIDAIRRALGITSDHDFRKWPEIQRALTAAAQAGKPDMEICDQCQGSGFNGNGTGYGDVCGKCGGQGGYPPAHEGETVEPPLPATQITEDDGTGDIISPAWRPPTSAPDPRCRADDWQLVPKVPTEAMERAGIDASPMWLVDRYAGGLRKPVARERTSLDTDEAKEIYVAMLAASPSPPAQSVEGGVWPISATVMLDDALGRIATLTKELAEARKVIEWTATQPDTGLEPPTEGDNHRRAARDWLERNKTTGEAG